MNQKDLDDALQRDLIYRIQEEVDRESALKLIKELERIQQAQRKDIIQ